MARCSPECCVGGNRAAGPERTPGRPARGALHLIRAYKIFVSPYFRGSCRFLPSCADYAAEAITVHGLLRGGWLAARRLARCHPLCAAGYDPVPRVESNFRGAPAPGGPLIKTFDSSL